MSRPLTPAMTAILSDIEKLPAAFRTNRCPAHGGGWLEERYGDQFDGRSVGALIDRGLVEYNMDYGYRSTRLASKRKT